MLTDTARFVPRPSSCWALLLLMGSLLLAPGLAHAQDFLFTQNGNSGTPSLRRADVNSNIALLDDTNPNLVNPKDVAYDPASGWVYWTDTGEASGFSDVGSIHRVQLGASTSEELVGGLSGPSGLVLDVPNNHMYWVDEGTGTLARANLDGSNVTTIVSGLSGPQYLALDTTNDKLYWTDANFGDAVQRANLDGSNVETLASSQANPSGIGLDVTGGKVYWVDEGNDTIRRANLDGSSPEAIVTSGLSQGADLTVDPEAGTLYWTDRGGFGSELSQANLDGTNAEFLFTTDKSQGLFLIEPQAQAMKTLSSDGTFSFPGTGVDITFSGSSGTFDVTVRRYADGPLAPDGISEAVVSSYRVVIEAMTEFRFQSIGTNPEVRFDANAFPGLNAPGDVTVYKRSSTTGGAFSTASSTNYESGPNEIVATVDGFSEFVLASNNSTDNQLPVELNAFDATRGEDAVRLSWETLTETDNAGFHIERAVDGGAFARIGFVEGAGTTAQTQSYDFRDADWPTGAAALTYRLRQVDLDGTATLQRPVTVGVGRPEALSLDAPFPNPARTTATLRYTVPDRETADIAIYDILGRKQQTLVTDAETGVHVHTVDVSTLPSGVYILRMAAGSAVHTQRLTVVR